MKIYDRKIKDFRRMEMRKAIVVGLTGPTGAGKTVVGEMLKKYGYSVIDADRISALVKKYSNFFLQSLYSLLSLQLFQYLLYRQR